MTSDFIDDPCWFCGERPSGGMYADHVVWVRAPADYQGGSQTTVWDERGVTVNRCEVCLHRHDVLKKISKILWVLAGLIIAAYLFWAEQWHTSADIFYIALGLIVAVVVARILLSIIQRLLGTQPEAVAKKHHEVREFLDRGAKLGRA